MFKNIENVLEEKQDNSLYFNLRTVVGKQSEKLFNLVSNKLIKIQGVPMQKLYIHILGLLKIHSGPLKM